MERLIWRGAPLWPHMASLITLATLLFVAGMASADIEKIAPDTRSSGSSASDLFWANRGRRDLDTATLPPANRPRPNGFWVGKRTTAIRPNGFLLVHRPRRQQLYNIDFDNNKEYEEAVDNPVRSSNVFEFEPNQAIYQDSFFAGRGKRGVPSNNGHLTHLESSGNEGEVQIENAPLSAAPLSKAQNKLNQKPMLLWQN